MSTILRICCLSFCIVFSVPGYAYDHTGHEVVAALASQYIAGSNAEKRVNALLAKFGPDITIEYAARWADCARGVNTRKTPIVYEVRIDQKSGKPVYPECQPFESALGQLLTENYVVRNLDQCANKATACHTQYHYTDVAIQRKSYDEGTVGKSDVDIVQSLGAAIAVLKGDKPAALFSMKDYEALMLLIHFVGDIHQPLHVGAVYLDDTGKVIDPDQGVFNPGFDNRGGNDIVLGGKKMHALWDDVSPDLAAMLLDPEHVRQMRKVALTRGAIDSWPTQWANETLATATIAFDGIAPFTVKRQPGATSDDFSYIWSAAMPAGYTERMKAIKADELQKAGARLGQLLMAIWP